MCMGSFIDLTSTFTFKTIRNYDEARKAYLNALKYDKEN